MRLLDQVAHAGEPVVVACPGDASPRRLPGTDTLAMDLAACPLRYVLADDVTELCTRLAFEDDSILGSSLELVRVPAPLWVEFTDTARQRVFTEFGRLDPAARRDFNRRVGLLVTGDTSGRKGRIDICWEEEGLSPAVAPFTIEYDLDDASFAKSIMGDDAVIGVTVQGAPALSALFKRVRFRLRPEWREFYQERAGDRYRDILLSAVRPIVEDVPFLAAFCLLLSSGSALRQASIDRSRLNTARKRRNRPHLLDHVELAMNLIGSEGGRPGAGERSSPRLHFVRGHLVRRGDAVYWRTSHMRGKVDQGTIRSRTIALRIGG